jgi:hypothetical protein
VIQDEVSADFDLLAQPGNLGFYSRCEITTAFLHDKASRRHVNLLTIAVLEEPGIPEKSDSRVSSSLLPVGRNSTWSLGVTRHYETPDASRTRLFDLLQNGLWSHDGDALEVGILRPLRKQFVPAADSPPVPLGFILKNNFENGSYVTEFFDERKTVLDAALSPDEIREARRLLKECLPMDLDAVPERVGNILFQFPVRVLATTERLDYDRGTVNVDISWHTALVNRPTLRLQAVRELDGALLDLATLDTNAHSVSLGTGAMDSPLRFEVTNPATQLVYSHFSGNFVRSIEFNMHVSVGAKCRTVRGEHGEARVEVHSREHSRVGEQPPDYEVLIRGRMLENEKAELERRGTFRQYCRRGEVQRDRALDDIRGLIAEHGANGVCLWDPFLTYRDILDTLYYSTVELAPLRAIGVFNRRTRRAPLVPPPRASFIQRLARLLRRRTRTWRHTYSTFLAEQIHGFESGSNNLGLNLEFRCVHENHGWDFHDRFLIFMPERKHSDPRAWSLGTSVNSLGNGLHHVVQEVSYAKVVLDAFEELWSELDHPDCLVWKPNNT